MKVFRKELKNGGRKTSFMYSSHLDIFSLPSLVSFKKRNIEMNSKRDGYLLRSLFVLLKERKRMRGGLHCDSISSLPCLIFILPAVWTSKVPELL